MLAWLTYLRATSAKKAAENAARLTRTTMRLFDGISDLSMAIASIEEIKRHYHVGQWPIVADRCSWVRRQLVVIKSSNPKWTDEQARILQQAITNLSNIESSINKATKPIKMPKLPTILTSDLDQLLQIAIQLRTTAEERANGD